MNNETKKKLIIQHLKENPNFSSSRIAKELGVSDKTVEKYRMDSNLRTGLDGRTCSYAIRKTINNPLEVDLYFIEGGGLIKIGKTDDISRRLRELQFMSPVPLKLKAFFPGFGKYEHSIHGTLYRYRKHGEWFEPAPQVLAMIERLNTEKEKLNNDNDKETTCEKET